jgi:hypothetical protein
MYPSRWISLSPPLFIGSRATPIHILPLLFAPTQDVLKNPGGYEALAYPDSPVGSSQYREMTTTTEGSGSLQRPSIYSFVACALVNSWLAHSRHLGILVALEFISHLLYACPSLRYTSSLESISSSIFPSAPTASSFPHFCGAGQQPPRNMV